MKQESFPDVMTPEQAAAYLQVSRETVLRYIRSGKLVASRLGRTYRISRRNVDLLLWSTRTEQELPLRQYTPQEVESFLADDQMDAKATDIANRFLAAQERSSARP